MLTRKDEGLQSMPQDILPRQSRIVPDHDWRGDLAAWWRRRPPPVSLAAQEAPELRRVLSELTRRAVELGAPTPRALQVALQVTRERLANAARLEGEAADARREWQAERARIDARATREARPPPLKPRRVDPRTGKRRALRRARVLWYWACAFAWCEGRSVGGRAPPGVEGVRVGRKARRRASDVAGWGEGEGWG